jgi:hypothetical protein
MQPPGSAGRAASLLELGARWLSAVCVMLAVASLTWRGKRGNRHLLIFEQMFESVNP